MDATEQQESTVASCDAVSNTKAVHLEEFAGHWLAVLHHIRKKAPRFDAEDLTQETFKRAAVSLSNNPQAYDSAKGAPLQWLRHIANNAINDAARTAKRHPSVGGSPGYVEDAIAEEGDDAHELSRDSPPWIHQWVDWVNRGKWPRPKRLTPAQSRACSRAEADAAFRRELTHNNLPVAGDETALRSMLAACNAQWRAGVAAYLARITPKPKKSKPRKAAPAIKRAVHIEANFT